MKPRKWTKEDLVLAARESKSIRQVLGKLGLRQAGGNYVQITRYLAEFGIDTSHFQGKGWNRGLKIPREPVIPLKEILIQNSQFQSHKLKKRLFDKQLKPKQCEECGWAKISEDGRLPLELDHINGNSRDNRMENLRILCPNCHSLKPTHRGKNIRRK